MQLPRGGESGPSEPRDDASTGAAAYRGSGLDDTATAGETSVLQPSMFGTGKAWTWFDYTVNLIVPLLILLAGFGVVAALGSVAPEPRPPEDRSPLGILKRLPPAEVMRVHSLQELDRPLELRVDGVVVPYREMQLAAEVSGRVIEKSPQCRAGNFVRAGQLLIRIDPTDYQQEVERLQRMVDQERESLNEIDQEMVNSRLQLEIAVQDVELAKREVDRLRALPSGYVSGAENDAAQKSLLMANQNRLTIENQINTLGVRRNRTEASQRLVLTQLETAQINLGRCEVRSVADGVIVQENVELNSFIQRGMPIITLEDVSKAEVAIQLRTDQLHWILDQRTLERHQTTSVVTTTTADQTQRNAPTAASDQPTPGDAASDEPVTDEPATVGPQPPQGYSLPETAAIIEYEVTGLAGRTMRWNGRLTRYDGIGLDAESRTVPVRVEVSAPQELIGEDGQPVQTTAQSALVRGMYVQVKLLIRPQTPLVAIPSLAMRPGNRVWQFTAQPAGLANANRTPDDDASKIDSKTTDDGASAVDSGQPIVADGSTDFDPADWTAGSVSVLGELTPVDSIHLHRDPSPATGKRPVVVGSATSGDTQRYWVCDVGHSGLQGGDWVVISPLSDLGNELGNDLATIRVRDLERSP